MNIDNNVIQETEFVFRRLSEAIRLGGSDIDPRLWLLVVIPLLLLGIVYVVWMYNRDSKAVGKLWATFLASLRIAVYAILALIFLLPAWQTWDKLENRSKVLVLIDVSGSMNSKDDIPTAAVPVEKLLSRQDKI